MQETHISLCDKHITWGMGVEATNPHFIMQQTIRGMGGGQQTQHMCYATNVSFWGWWLLQQTRISLSKQAFLF